MKFTATQDFTDGNDTFAAGQTYQPITAFDIQRYKVFVQEGKMTLHHTDTPPQS